MKLLEDALVLENREIRPGIWSMWLSAPGICAQAAPGQFVHLRIRQSFSPLLRRPLSIGRVNGDRLELVWRVVGKGTALLAEARQGDAFSLLGPLGRAFTVAEGVENTLLVAGGLGLPPLVYLYEELKRHMIEAALLLGVKDESGIPLAEDDPVSPFLEISTERESGFRQGLVTAPAAEYLVRKGTEGKTGKTAVYVCGPWGLIETMQKMISGMSVMSAEVSLEQQMGCGVGVCQGCAVWVKGDAGPYRLACSDGPVFPLLEAESPNGR